MSLWWILLVPVAIFAVFIVLQVRRYGKLFSEDHFRELHDGFVEAVQQAQRDAKQRGDEDAVEPVGFVSKQNVALSVSLTRTDEAGRQLHIGISQADRPTTGAVASRLGFFLITVLNQNEMELTPFFTESRVHHLVFENVPSNLKFRSFEPSFEAYTRDYQPVPYVPEDTIANEPS